MPIFVLIFLLIIILILIICSIIICTTNEFKSGGNNTLRGKKIFGGIYDELNIIWEAVKGLPTDLSADSTIDKIREKIDDIKIVYGTKIKNLEDEVKELVTKNTELQDYNNRLIEDETRRLFTQNLSSTQDLPSTQSGILSSTQSSSHNIEAFQQKYLLTDHILNLLKDIIKNVQSRQQDIIFNTIDSMDTGDIQKDIEDKIIELYNDLESVENDNSKLEDELKSVRLLLVSLSQKSTALQQQNTALQQQNTTLQQENSTLNTSTFSNILNSTNTTAEMKQLAESAKASITSLGDQIKTLNAQLIQKELELSQASDKIQAKADIIADNLRQLLQLTTDNQELGKQLNDMKDLLSQKDTDMANINSLLSDERRVIFEKNNQISKMLAQILILTNMNTNINNKNIDNIQTEISNLESKINALDKAKGVYTREFEKYIRENDNKITDINALVRRMSTMI